MRASFRRADHVNYLRYHFDSSSSDPVVLRYDFDFPVEPDQLHKLMFSFKADNSWHAIDATLDVGGKHWKSERSLVHRADASRQHPIPAAEL